MTGSAMPGHLTLFKVGGPPLPACPPPPQQLLSTSPLERSVASVVSYSRGAGWGFIPSSLPSCARSDWSSASVFRLLFWLRLGLHLLSSCLDLHLRSSSLDAASTPSTSHVRRLVCSCPHSYCISLFIVMDILSALSAFLFIFVLYLLPV